MSWVPPGRAKERILVYGDMGTWKSCGALEIAKKVDGKVHIIDTDNAHGMILDRLYPDLGNVELYDGLDGWAGIKAAIDKAFKVAGPNDWIVLDSTSDMWDACTDFYFEKVTGKSKVEFLNNWLARVGQKDAKKQGIQGVMIEYGLYDFINPDWRSTVANRTKASRCHLYMTAQPSDTGGPHEDSLSRKTYGSFGKKPRTQKALGFNAATVLLLDQDKVGNRTFTVVKDWGRQGKDLPRDVKYNSFANDFLLKVAGWKPAAG